MEILFLLLLFAMGNRGSQGPQGPHGPTGGGAGPEPEPGPAPELPPAPEAEGEEFPARLSPGAVRAIAAELGLSPDWGTFLAAVARGESDFVRGAIGTQDASAAAAGYQRNADEFAGCGVPEDRYTQGSIGLYQLLPTSGLAAWFGTPYRCMDPIEALSNPYVATIAAVEYARRVRNWSDWGRSDKTWGALRRGFRSPGLTDADRPDVDARFRTALQRNGTPVSFANQKADGLPAGWDPVELVARYVEAPGGA